LLRTTFFSAHPTTKPDMRRVSIELRGSQTLLTLMCESPAPVRSRT
jgi:hypothetical protein